MKRARVDCRIETKHDAKAVRGIVCSAFVPGVSGGETGFPNEDHSFIRGVRWRFGRTADFTGAYGKRAVRGEAERLGFSDLSSFSQAFKRWYGVPPGTCRSGLLRDGGPH